MADPRALLCAAQPRYRTEEILGVGLDISGVDVRAYDAVDHARRQVALEQLDILENHYRAPPERRDHRSHRVLLRSG